MDVEKIIKSIKVAMVALHYSGQKIENDIESHRVRISIKNEDGLIYSESYSYERIKELLMAVDDINRLGIYLVGEMLNRAKKKRII